MATEGKRNSWEPEDLVATAPQAKGLLGRIGRIAATIPIPADFLNAVLLKNIIPDRVLRPGVRLLMWTRKREFTSRTVEDQQEYRQRFVDNLCRAPIALVPDLANEQHYEVPSEFYRLCLGNQLKYSCAYYKTPTSTLDEAELAMLELYVERAQLEDGQTILDLGCGWGSFSLFACERFPKSKVVAVSNSSTQRAFIEAEAARRGLTNLRVITCDINDLDAKTLGLASAGAAEPAAGTGKKGRKAGERKVSSAGSEGGALEGFDRVVSIEMFEHVKNYQLLFSRIAKWLRPNGKLFVHIFCHREYMYHFIGDNWMTKYFFSGGTMPSADLFYHFQRDLNVVKHWRVNGTHYARTSRDWLGRMDRNAKQIKEIFAKTYGASEANKWFIMWRMFYLAVEECFGYNNGHDWMVGHYLFQRPQDIPIVAATATAASEGEEGAEADAE